MGCKDPYSQQPVVLLALLFKGCDNLKRSIVFGPQEDMRGLVERLLYSWQKCHHH
jgi:hypothetical protein